MPICKFSGLYKDVPKIIDCKTISGTCKIDKIAFQVMKILWQICQRQQVCIVLKQLQQSIHCLE